MDRRHRLRRTGDFRRILREGRSVARPEFVLYYAPRDGRHRVRVGFAVGKRMGGAVVRNRAKRRLREAAGALIPRLEPGMDVVVVAREPAATARVSELESALVDAAARAGLIRRQTEEDTST